VGSLIETGRGNLDESGWRELLANRAGKAGPTAPAKGLFLVSVEYAADGGKPGSGLL
jgi:tRNA U38,U39,U40 pseudouridine synthase TruA